MNPHTVNTDVDQLRLLLWFVSQILAPKVTAHSEARTCPARCVTT